MNNASNSSSAVTLSLRIAPEIRDQLDDLAIATHRTKSFLAAEAIEHYLAIQAWQISSIRKTLEKANNENANFVNHDKVVDWLNSWGTKREMLK